MVDLSTFQPKRPKRKPKQNKNSLSSLKTIASVAVKKPRKSKNSIENIALIAEFENYLSKKGYEFQKNKLFKNYFDLAIKWEADYVIEKEKFFVEINGGQYINGRHNRGGFGYEFDLLKLNAAQKNGFKIYQFTYQMLKRREYEMFF